MSSPSTNPSSCDSVPNFLPVASTSGSLAEECSATAAYGGMKTSSPAMANPAPGQEPHYPVGSIPKKIFFTTEMANEAAEDFKKEKFGSIHEWYERYQKRLGEKKAAEGKEHKAVKRKLEEDEGGDGGAKRVALEADVKVEPVEVKEEKPVYESIGELPAKTEENPLKKMEMMAHFSVIQASTRITEVAADNQGKKEKADKSDNGVRDENSMPQQMMPPMPFPHPATFSPQPMAQMASPLPSPYGPPMPPPHMMMPYPGMHFPPGARPPFPPGKQGSAPGMGHFPGMPPFPMGHPGMRMSPAMMPQYQQFCQMMAARGGMPSPTGGMSPFPGMPRMMPPYSMMPPGPLSGPNPMMNKGLPHGGPMTAPMAVPSPYAPMASPYHHAPSQGSPMIGGPDSAMVQNPIFSFSDASAAPGHPSMLQDKPPF